MRKAIIAYVPVLHAGYHKLFEDALEADTILVISEKLVASFEDEFDYIRRKDALRALSAQDIVAAIEGLGFKTPKKVMVLEPATVSHLRRSKFKIIAPDEDISRAVIGRHFPDFPVEFKSIFLRWHRDNVHEKKKAAAHKSIPVSDFDRGVMKLARQEANQSFDWWRQIGAVLIKNGEVALVAHNRHQPDEQLPYALGDPRSIFKRGMHFDLSTAEHAEATLIGEAACRGISTKEAWLYVTDFPCPFCAKLIARSGIERCYFSGGYAMLEGENDLKRAGIKLIYVDLDPSS